MKVQRSTLIGACAQNTIPNLLLQIAPNVVLTDEEIEYRQKTEFQAFCEEENAFLRELGLIKDEELPIPE